MTWQPMRREAARPRWWLVVLGLAFAAACSDSERASVTEPRIEQAPERPSVLLVTLDTLRADHLGVYGHPEAPSRAFDALAADGLLFERAIAASSRTAPSHASIMTSRFVRDHNIQHGNGKTRLGDEPTLARILSREGFATAAFVSNTVLRRHTGFAPGFDVYDDDLTDAEGNRAGMFERNAEDTAARALAWLESVDTPFFLWVHLIDPHGPYTPHPGFSDGITGRVPPRFPDAPNQALPILTDQSGFEGIPAYQVYRNVVDPADYRARYVSEIRYADHALGRVVAAAERAAGRVGLVSVVTADHGESLGEEHFHFAHGHATTPELTHVPLLVRAPGVEAARVSALAHHVDILPTLLGRLGIAMPPETAGIDLVGPARGERPFPDRVVFSDVGREITAYRGDVFERLRYQEAAPEAEPVRTTHRWSETAPWPSAPRDPRLGTELDAYLARTGSYILAPALTPDLNAELRALGYLEPEAEEAPKTAPQPNASDE